MRGKIENETEKVSPYPMLRKGQTLRFTGRSTISSGYPAGQTLTRYRRKIFDAEIREALKSELDQVKHYHPDWEIIEVGIAEDTPRGRPSRACANEHSTKICSQQSR